MRPLRAGALFLVDLHFIRPPLQFVGPENEHYSRALVDSAAPLSHWRL